MRDFLMSWPSWLWVLVVVIGLEYLALNFFIKDYMKTKRALREVLHETDWNLIRHLARRGTTDADFLRKIAADAGVEMAEVNRRCHEMLIMIGEEDGPPERFGVR